MDSWITVLTVVSGIASIVGVLMPAPNLKQRIFHVLYGLFIAALATVALSFQTQLNAMRAIEQQAQTLLESADLNTSSSSRGFVLASLAFLEKNKEALPDTYQRAVQLSQNSGVLENRQQDGLSRLYQNWSMEENAGAMKYLLTGLATQHPER